VLYFLLISLPDWGDPQFAARMAAFIAAKERFRINFISGSLTNRSVI